MAKHRIFLSHSSANKDFAKLAVARLRAADMEPWIDTENIAVGSDILDAVGSGLKTMDLFVVILSKESLSSAWVDRELKFAVLQEIQRKQALVMPFIIDETRISDLPWYLANTHARRIACDGQGAENLASAVRDLVARRSYSTNRATVHGSSCHDSRVDRIIAGVSLGDWLGANRAALAMIKLTESSGRNPVLEALINYVDLSDEDGSLWSALHTIECCAELAPSQFSRGIMSRMATHQNFSVRSSAASICMRWAQFAPDRVPLDIALRLSRYDEDWYVERPANAALKAMASSMREVLGVFFSRLESKEAEERAHAALNILEIAQTEPAILDMDALEAEVGRLRKNSDEEALDFLVRAKKLVKSSTHLRGFKYGL